MKATLPNLKKLARRRRTPTAANSEPLQHEDIEPAEPVVEVPKPPPPLSLFFMLSHL